MKVSLLLLSVIASVVVCTDPLLLEYSDYYYDLYYGDYEDYVQPSGIVQYQVLKNIYMQFSSCRSSFNRTKIYSCGEAGGFEE